MVTYLSHIRSLGPVFVILNERDVYVGSLSSYFPLASEDCGSWPLLRGMDGGGVLTWAPSSGAKGLKSAFYLLHLSAAASGTNQSSISIFHWSAGQLKLHMALQQPNPHMQMTGGFRFRNIFASCESKQSNCRSNCYPFLNIIYFILGFSQISTGVSVVGLHVNFAVVFIT